jgi:hypothetical protein
MTGFGIRALKKVQEEETKDARKYFKHIVYGENSFAVLTFLKLHKKYPGEVKIITKNPFYKEDLLKEWSCSLNSVRSEEVANKLSSLSAGLEVFKTTEDVTFYKDTKFHKFGGRAKPHELKEGESFFSDSFYNINMQALFSPEDFEKMDELLKEHQLNRIIQEIEVSTPEDLVEVTNFKIMTGEHESFHCEKLYFCESPKTFYSLVEDKNSLSDELQAFIAPVANHQGICVHYTCDKEINKQEGTILLPQSVTHEWGSFMLDFDKFNPATNTQEFKALTFIGEDEVQEDDLAKKIKLMNRVIERVLPEFGEAKVEQSIKFNAEFRVSGINDEYYSKIQNEHVMFLGQSAPINVENSEKYQYAARAITAILTSEF